MQLLRNWCFIKLFIPECVNILVKILDFPFLMSNTQNVKKVKDKPSNNLTENVLLENRDLFSILYQYTYEPS